MQALASVGSCPAAGALVRQGAIQFFVHHIKQGGPSRNHALVALGRVGCTPTFEAFEELRAEGLLALVEACLPVYAAPVRSDARKPAELRQMVQAASPKAAGASGRGASASASAGGGVGRAVAGTTEASDGATPCVEEAEAEDGDPSRESAVDNLMAVDDAGAVVTGPATDALTPTGLQGILLCLAALCRDHASHAAISGSPVALPRAIGVLHAKPGPPTGPTPPLPAVTLRTRLAVLTAFINLCECRHFECQQVFAQDAIRGRGTVVPAVTLLTAGQPVEYDVASLVLRLLVCVRSVSGGPDVAIHMPSFLTTCNALLTAPEGVVEGAVPLSALAMVLQCHVLKVVAVATTRFPPCRLAFVRSRVTEVSRLSELPGP